MHRPPASDDDGDGPPPLVSESSGDEEPPGQRRQPWIHADVGRLDVRDVRALCAQPPVEQERVPAALAGPVEVQEFMLVATRLMAQVSEHQRRLVVEVATVRMEMSGRDPIALLEFFGGADLMMRLADDLVEFVQAEIRGMLRVDLELPHLECRRQVLMGLLDGMADPAPSIRATYGV
jgi:hypothetical protein